MSAIQTAEPKIVAPAAAPTLAESMALAMRRLVKSVCIVTTVHEGKKMAMAATAIDSLSLDPPSLLVCINRTASIYPAFVAGMDFNVNILSDDHEGLAHLCHGPVKGEARFREGAWREDAVPYLADAQAVVFCSKDGEFQYGTHGVFVGRVKDVRLHGEIDPLIYADGAYGTTFLRRSK
jgi:flavin reductase (DIM6/NTAB) family NADH-FMN oxidoreductase RutF